MSKENSITRNDPCHCGSGKKYKKCHLDQDKEKMREELSHILMENEAKEYQRKRQQGLGKPIISETFKGHRFVAVGNRLYYSDKWKTFHDFLRQYFVSALGEHWGTAQLKKDISEMHPIMQWYCIVEEYLKRMLADLK
jgi:hypothetical protein